MNKSPNSFARLLTKIKQFLSVEETEDARGDESKKPAISPITTEAQDIESADNASVSTPPTYVVPIVPHWFIM